jgi:hypothetical protein
MLYQVLACPHRPSCLLEPPPRTTTHVNIFTCPPDVILFLDLNRDSHLHFMKRFYWFFWFFVFTSFIEHFWIFNLFFFFFYDWCLFLSLYFKILIHVDFLE